MSPRESHHRQVVVDQCQRCQGLWFDPNELDFFLADKTTTKGLYQNGPVNPVISDKQCPLCAKSMVAGLLPNAKDLRQIEVDYCAKCHGIFLNKGELSELVERQTNKKNLGAFTTHTEHLPSNAINHYELLRQQIENDPVIKQKLMPGEEILWGGRPHNAATVLPWIGIGAFFLPIFIYQNFYNRELVLEDPFILKVNLFFFILFIFYITMGFLRLRKNLFVVTNRRVLWRQGFISPYWMAMDLATLDEISLRHSGLEKLFSLGTLQIKNDRGQLFRWEKLAHSYIPFRLVQSLKARARWFQKQ